MHYLAQVINQVIIFVAYILAFAFGRCVAPLFKTTPWEIPGWSFIISFAIVYIFGGAYIKYKFQKKRIRKII